MHRQFYRAGGFLDAADKGIDRVLVSKVDSRWRECRSSLIAVRWATPRSVDRKAACRKEFGERRAGGLARAGDEGGHL